jgi:hypothetical protein
LSHIIIAKTCHACHFPSISHCVAGINRMMTVNVCVFILEFLTRARRTRIYCVSCFDESVTVHQSEVKKRLIEKAEI